jgi:hypothetical protein
MSPLEELSGIGLTVPLDERTVRDLWAELLRVDASVRRSRPERPAEPVRDAYHAIARHVVKGDTPDQILEEMIPRMIFSFCSTRPWARYGNREILRGVLEPSVLEWKAARLQMDPTLQPDVPSVGKQKETDTSVPTVPYVFRNTESAAFWRERREEFDRLASRQREALGGATHARLLRGCCFFPKGSEDLSRCEVGTGFDGRLISDFEEIASRAAYGLKCPLELEPVRFWLYSLAQSILKSGRQEVQSEILGDIDSGGIVHDLLASSAGFCSRLAAEAARSYHGVQGQRTQTPPPTAPPADTATNSPSGPTVPRNPGMEQSRPAERPEIWFEKWDLAPIPGIGISAGQAGFYLANDGITAHGVSIESVRIGGRVANGAVISRIEAKGKTFMLVWIEGYPPGAPEKWDLIGAMTAESSRLGCGDIHAPSYNIEIVAKYHDSRGIWYRSRSRLTYIASQRRLSFGETAIERTGVVQDGDAAPRSALTSTAVPVTSPPVSTPIERSTQDSPSSEGAMHVDGESMDFTSETGRRRALAGYTNSWSCSEASLARTAAVDAADLTKWKSGTLPSESVKKSRIEKALRDNEPPTLPVRPPD